MSIQAKKPGSTESSSLSHLDGILPHNSALAHVLVSVTTGQPTVTTASRPHPSWSHTATRSPPVCTTTSQPSQTPVSTSSSDAVTPVPKTTTVQRLPFRPIEVAVISTGTPRSTPQQLSPKIVLPKRPTSAPKLCQPVTILTSNIDVVDTQETPKKFVSDGDLHHLDVAKPANQQLSPTLEDKLASSTGIIENLDGFCVVADIIAGSSSAEDGSQDDEEIDIDIENDDDNDENSILKSRSASPNSVYERLLKAANIRNKDSSQKDIDVKIKLTNKVESVPLDHKAVVKSPVRFGEEDCEMLLVPEASSEVTVFDGGQSSSLSDSKHLDTLESTSVTSEVISESSEDWSTESNCGDERKICKLYSPTSNKT